MKYRTDKEEEAFNYAVDNELICNEEYCPWWQEHRFSLNCPTCEGSYCEEAWDNYKDKNWKDEDCGRKKTHT